MRIKPLLVISSVVLLVVYNVLTFKVGPCSPEMEILINNKHNE